MRLSGKRDRNCCAWEVALVPSYDRSIWCYQRVNCVGQPVELIINFLIGWARMDSMVRETVEFRMSNVVRMTVMSEG